jgi:hypothetical protein
VDRGWVLRLGAEDGVKRLLLRREQRGRGRVQARAVMAQRRRDRLEQRSVTCTDDLDDYLAWPGVQHLLRLVYERTIRRTGEGAISATYARTSLSAAEARVTDLARFWPEH